MSDVFISYARSSEEQAKQVEQALRDNGFAVWRDDELPAHRTYADVIEERLKAGEGGGGPVVRGRFEIPVGARRS